MKVLADSSVWIDHFRRANPRLRQLLLDGEIVIHPGIVGELACRTLLRRAETIEDLLRLPCVKTSEENETMFVIEARRLWGKGIGWVDAQLVASCLLSGCGLWTLDKRLGAVAEKLRIAA